MPLFNFRHHVAVARALRRAGKLAPQTPDGQAGVGAAIAEIMEMFAKDSPSFHEFKFFEACTAQDYEDE